MELFGDAALIFKQSYTLVLFSSSQHSLFYGIVRGSSTSFDPPHGLHFEQSMAGQDLSQALLVTCTPALTIAGLIGIFGARWMKDDIAAAELADRIRSKV